MTMAYRPLVCKIGGARITLPCRLVKSGVDKTWTMVGGMWGGKVEKESRKDMFLPLFAEQLF